MNNFSTRTGKLFQIPKTIFHAYEPKPLPLDINYDSSLITKLSEADQSIGKLSGIGYRLKNPHLLITPYLKKEAVLSSKIEGTRTSLSEVFIHEKKPTRSESPDIIEVINYIKALEFGLKEIETKDISEKLIKGMHAKLMEYVRGKDKDPGHYKHIQNWIGSSNDILEAKFVPCTPESVPRLMGNFVEYLNSHKENPSLIKAGIMHYQFETIHPFRDGNGRIGRLLIVLFLCKSGLLSQPLLYPSGYFEKYRDEYDESLYNASYKGDIERWLKFFLHAVKVQADDALERAMKLDEYHDSCRDLLEKETQTTNVLRVLEQLFVNPYITIPEASNVLNCHYPTAKNNIDILIEKGILKEVAKRGRERLFSAPEIMDVLEV